MKKKLILPLFSLLFLNWACNKKTEALPETPAKDSTTVVADSTIASPAPEFNQVLKYEKYAFAVSAKGDELTITPSGLEEVNTPLTQKIDGTVKNVEIGDINGDNKPEVFVYLSKGPEERGSVVGYSSNAGKSMSEVYFPEMDAKYKDGYNGHDEFAMVENTFAQRFPLFDAKGNKTGKTRQIQYKLKDGEAMRSLVVDRVIEF